VATTIAAMKARLGNTDYYILSMKAKELTEKVTIPRKDTIPQEEEGWEERYQCDINYNRVKSQIAPYLANDDSRFFGAIIVAAMNFSQDDAFEPLSEIAADGLPRLYKEVATNMGFLTFSGGEILVPLDGQHRLKAIEFAMTGRDERGRNIDKITTPCTQLADEDVTVILVPYEVSKARHISTCVNRYARSAPAGQNYVTDDNDVIAVLSREVANALIGGRLAKYTGNTLGPKDVEFTTLSTIYNCNERIILHTFPEDKLDKTNRPSEAKETLYRKTVKEVWRRLLDHIDVFADALSDTEETGDEKRREIRKSNLLGKPVAQECLVRAFVCLTHQSPNAMSYVEACKKLNAVPWGITEENLKIWQRVLWSGGTDGKIITKNRNLTTDLVLYLAGKPFTAEDLDALRSNYLKQFPESEREGKDLPQLPKPRSLWTVSRLVRSSSP